jgi:hypothetical protein
MRRRNFIAGFAYMTAAWSLAARAQQPVRMRLIDVPMGWDLASDSTAIAPRLRIQAQVVQLSTVMNIHGPT